MRTLISNLVKVSAEETQLCVFRVMGGFYIVHNRVYNAEFQLYNIHSSTFMHAYKHSYVGSKLNLDLVP